METADNFLMLCKEENLKVTPIYLKYLNQVCLQKKKKVAIHYCIAIVCSVVSDDR